MATLKEVRQQYPEYADMNDSVLADALHKKFYADMPRAEFDQKVGFQPQSNLDTAAGVTKALGAGVVNGFINLADIPSLVDAGAAWLNPKLVSMGIAKPRSELGIEPTPQYAPGIRKKVEEYTGPLHKPQTAGEQYAHTVGEFGSGLLGGGPGGLLTKVATRAVLPGVLSEGAGQLTAGTAAEPFARIGGGLLGGVGGAVAQRSMAAGKGGVPTVDDLKTKAQALYKTAEQQGVVIAQPSFRNAVDDMARTIRSAGVDETLHPNVTAAWKRMDAAAQAGHIPLEEAEILRRVLKSSMTSNVADERRIAAAMLDKFDNYIEGLKPSDMALKAMGNNLSPADVQKRVTEATKTLSEARTTWSQVRKSETINDLIESAKLRASQFSGSGYENALRTEFRQFARNENAMRAFTKAEQSVIKSIATGGAIENGLRALGRFAIRGPVTGTTSLGAAWAAGDPMVGMMLAGLGEVGRAGATGLTRAKAINAGEVMRGGTYLPPVTEDALRAALLSGMAATQQRRQPQR